VPTRSPPTIASKEQSIDEATKAEIAVKEIMSNLVTVEQALRSGVDPNLLLEAEPSLFDASNVNVAITDHGLNPIDALDNDLIDPRTAFEEYGVDPLEAMKAEAITGKEAVEIGNVTPLKALLEGFLDSKTASEEHGIDLREAMQAKVAIEAIKSDKMTLEQTLRSGVDPNLLLEAEPSLFDASNVAAAITDHGLNPIDALDNGLINTRSAFEEFGVDPMDALKANAVEAETAILKGGADPMEALASGLISPYDAFNTFGVDPIAALANGAVTADQAINTEGGTNPITALAAGLIDGTAAITEYDVDPMIAGVDPNTAATSGAWTSDSEDAYENFGQGMGTAFAGQITVNEDGSHSWASDDESQTANWDPVSGEGTYTSPWGEQGNFSITTNPETGIRTFNDLDTGTKGTLAQDGTLNLEVSSAGTSSSDPHSDYDPSYEGEQGGGPGPMPQVPAAPPGPEAAPPGPEATPPGPEDAPLPPPIGTTPVPPPIFDPSGLNLGNFDPSVVPTGEGPSHTPPTPSGDGSQTGSVSPQKPDIEEAMQKLYGGPGQEPGGGDPTISKADLATATAAAQAEAEAKTNEPTPGEPPPTDEFVDADGYEDDESDDPIDDPLKLPPE
jgi:hypothetical protein